MPTDVPIELLRTLTALQDTGTLRAASERVARTPSALSLQMARLEDLVGVALFERRGRNLDLTAAGREFAVRARDILERHDEALRSLRDGEARGPARIGLVQDFAEPVLPAILRRIRLGHPGLRLEVRVAGSVELARAIQAGELDAAVAVRGRSSAPVLRTEPMVWLGDDGLRTEEPLPLVLVDDPCPFSDAAQAALTAAGRRFRVAMRTPSLSGVAAAIEAGLGLGCRSRLFAGGRLPVLRPGAGLPDLPAVRYTLLLGPAGPATEMLAASIGDVVRALP